MPNANKFTVHTRIAMLENAVTELRKENAELRVHLKGALETAVNDAKNTIQDSIRVPVDGKDGRDGTNGAAGPQGIQGVPGDVTYVTPSEVAAQMQALRLKLAKWQAALHFAYEQNYGGKSRGLQAAIDATLKTIEKNVA